MKRNNITAAVMTVACLTVTPLVQASPLTDSQTRISLNGTNATDPKHVTAVDPSSKQRTAFLPIFYVINVLKTLGVQSTWNGRTWAMTTPKDINPILTQPAVGPNQMTITMNGKAVQTAPKLVAIDPASGRKTTFVPIYYLSQVLQRIGVAARWNGTDWKLQTQAVTANHVETTVIPETQRQMVNAMWNVFNHTDWAVNTPATMVQSGVNPTSGPATAADVATWLAQWAGQSKGYKAAPYDSQSQAFVPFSLKYEASANAYTWAADNGLYQGTQVRNGDSVISATDLTTVLANLKWWLTGDRVENGIHHLHAPMYGNYVTWTKAVQSGNLTTEQYQQALAEETRYFDQITATVTGSTINLTLPDTAKSAEKIAWSVTNGSYTYGYTSGNSRTGAMGGKTLHFSLGTAGGIDITEWALADHSLKMEVYYLNQNGSPVFNQPYDGGNGQH